MQVSLPVICLIRSHCFGWHDHRDNAWRTNFTNLWWGQRSRWEGPVQAAGHFSAPSWGRQTHPSVSHPVSPRPKLHGFWKQSQALQGTIYKKYSPFLRQIFISLIVFYSQNTIRSSFVATEHWAGWRLHTEWQAIKIKYVPRKTVSLSRFPPYMELIRMYTYTIIQRTFKHNRASREKKYHFLPQQSM